MATNGTGRLEQLEFSIGNMGTLFLLSTEIREHYIVVFQSEHGNKYPLGDY